MSSPKTSPFRWTGLLTSAMTLISLSIQIITGNSLICDDLKERATGDEMVVLWTNTRILPTLDSGGWSVFVHQGGGLTTETLRGSTVEVGEMSPEMRFGHGFIQHKVTVSATLLAILENKNQQLHEVTVPQINPLKTKNICFI
jgi:hypothetical protein